MKKLQNSKEAVKKEQSSLGSYFTFIKYLNSYKKSIKSKYPWYLLLFLKLVFVYQSL